MYLGAACLPLNSVGNQTRAGRLCLVPWNIPYYGASHAHVNRLEIGGFVVLRNTGGTTCTISLTHLPRGPGGRPRRTDRQDPSVLFLLPGHPDIIRSPLCLVGKEEAVVLFLCTGASLYAPYSLMLISNKFWMRGRVKGGWEGGDWGVSGGEARGPSWRGRIRGVEREGRGGFT